MPVVRSPETGRAPARSIRRTRHAPPGEGNVPLFDLSATYSRWWSSFCQIWWGRNAGPHALEAERRYRLDALVRFARRHSPLYRDAYRGLPEHVLTPEPLPVMTKHDLMSRFDDVQDRDALSVYDALIAVQLASTELASKCAEGLLLKGGRAALIAVIGEHFAGTASWERVCRSTPAIAARSFSIMEPLEHLVAELNAFAPAYLASYPTMLTLLADERNAGRLRVNPAIVWSGGEGLAPRTHAKLERAFQCPAVNEYGGLGVHEHRVRTTATT